MNIFVVIAGTILIGLFSWFFSIRQKRYHGIPRFFAFESIFLLVLLNIRLWFHNPFSINQIFSWILLILSAYFAIAGFLILKRKGESTGNIEATTVLIKTGVYHLIRHPLYLALLLLGTGVMLKNPTSSCIVLATINLLSLFFTALTEEKEMIEKFGDAYKEYMKETKMFIPYLL